MNIAEFVESTYHKIGLLKMELISSYKKGYIGKNTYKVTLRDGTVKTVDQIIKNGNNGDAVIIFPMTKDNRVVAIVESRPLTRTGINLSLPAGMIDNNEEAISAAKRELREETGYVSDELIPLEWHYQDIGCSKAIIYTFLAKNCIKKYEQELDGTERLETLEITMEDMEKEMDNHNNDNFKDSGSKIAYQYILKQKNRKE